MKTSSRLWFRAAAAITAAGFLFASNVTFAQEAPPYSSNQQDAPVYNGPVDQSGAPVASAPDGAPEAEQAPPAPSPEVQAPSQQQPVPYSNQPNGPAWNQGPSAPPSGYGYPQQYPAYGPPSYGPPQQGYGQPPAVPAELTIAPGTFITVRVNQMLSSSKSQQGDPFTATLVSPVVVNGVVVAEPGQTIAGVIADVHKADPARLLVRLTDLTLADGQQIPIQTALTARKGPGFNGRDAGTVIGTTVLGTAVGGAIGWGTGAAIGAGAGALLGAIVTHNHPSVVYPEQELTFRIENAVTFSTMNAPMAFHYIEPGEYADADHYNQPRRPAPAYVAAPAPLYYPYPYSWWGPSIGFTFWGGRNWGGPGYWRGPYWHGPVVGRGFVRR